MRKLEQIDNDVAFLNLSLYTPIQSHKKSLEKIEITEFIQKEDYVQYRILTRFNNSSSDTFRRYSDFEKLNNYLKYVFNKNKKYKMMPKIPSKHNIQNQIKDFDESSRREFCTQRKEDLEIYLNQLIKIQAIKEDKIIQEFLSSREQLQELNKALNSEKIEIPLTKPEKILDIFKKTWNNIYKFWQNWNQNYHIKIPLRQKMEKIQKIMTLFEALLQNQRIRIRMLQSQSKDLYNAFNTKENGNTIINKFKNLLVSKQIESKKFDLKSSKMPALADLQEYMQKMLRQQMAKMQRIYEIKKDIKSLISVCQSIIFNFEELCAEKLISEENIILFQNEIKIEQIIKNSKKILQRYQIYYQIITNQNKIQQSLTKIEENRQQDAF